MGGGRKQVGDVPIMRLRPEDGASVMRSNTRPRAGRITLVSSGTVDGFEGACRTQHGCCSPHGMAVELIARNRIGEIRV